MRLNRLGKLEGKRLWVNGLARVASNFAQYAGASGSPKFRHHQPQMAFDSVAADIQARGDLFTGEAIE